MESNCNYIYYERKRNISQNTTRNPRQSDVAQSRNNTSFGVPICLCLCGWRTFRPESQQQRSTNAKDAECLAIVCVCDMKHMICVCVCVVLDALIVLGIGYAQSKHTIKAHVWRHSQKTILLYRYSVARCLLCCFQDISSLRVHGNALCCGIRNPCVVFCDDWTWLKHTNTTKHIWFTCWQ